MRFRQVSIAGGKAFGTGPAEDGLLDEGGGDEHAAEGILFEDFLPIKGFAVRGRVLPEPLGVGARRILITTDGVFSMDGTIAQLDKICDLADEFDAMVHHDDCHATGFMGKTGRGVHEYCGVMDRVDIITSTFGKALGGASGGFTSGRKEIIDMLRQRSRPYLFSNTVAPSICAATLEVIDMLNESTALRDRLEDNTHYFRKGMRDAGFAIDEGDHPIVPVMLGDANLAQNMSKKLLDEGIYAIGFFFPVVPKDKARIRTQISAAHSKDDLDKAIHAFTKVYQELKN